MIDQIHFKQVSQDSKTYDIARIWVAGICFTADLDPHVETAMRRVAAGSSIDILDTRNTK